MGLKEILERIKEETELKKQEILDKALEDRDKILDDAKKRAEQIIKKAEEEKAKLVSQRVNALVADFVIKSNVKLTALKREILEEVYGEVLNRILSDRKLYESILNHLLENLDLKGNEVLYIAEKDPVIDDDFINKINGQKGWNISISDKRVNIKGGFIAKGENTQIDASLEKFMEIVREETEVHVSKILFG
ncbi:MAG: V-type ATP synthase subunit E [candidate division WOR-3 bacterium]